MGMPGWYEGPKNRADSYITDGRHRRHRVLVRPVFLGIFDLSILQWLCVSTTFHLFQINQTENLKLRTTRNEVWSKCSILFKYMTFIWILRKFYFFFHRVTGAMGICFPYLGEFQPTKYRERCLCWMELFWTVGVIVLPCKCVCIWSSSLYSSFFSVKLNLNIKIVPSDRLADHTHQFHVRERGVLF